MALTMADASMLPVSHRYRSMACWSRWRRGGRRPRRRRRRGRPRCRGTRSLPRWAGGRPRPGAQPRRRPPKPRGLARMWAPPLARRARVQACGVCQCTMCTAARLAPAPSRRAGPGGVTVHGAHCSLCGRLAATAACVVSRVDARARRRSLTVREHAGGLPVPRPLHRAGAGTSVAWRAGPRGRACGRRLSSASSCRAGARVRRRRGAGAARRPPGRGRGVRAGAQCTQPRDACSPAPGAWRRAGARAARPVGPARGLRPPRRSWPRRARRRRRRGGARRMQPRGGALHCLRRSAGRAGRAPADPGAPTRTPSCSAPHPMQAHAAPTRMRPARPPRAGHACPVSGRATCHARPGAARPPWEATGLCCCGPRRGTHRPVHFERPGLGTPPRGARPRHRSQGPAAVRMLLACLRPGPFICVRLGMWSRSSEETPPLDLGFPRGVVDITSAYGEAAGSSCPGIASGRSQVRDLSRKSGRD